jgi:hypothetical protein
MSITQEMLPTLQLLHLFPGASFWLGLFSYHILVKQVGMGTLEVPVGGIGVV